MLDRETALAMMGFNPGQQLTQRTLNDRYLDLRMNAFGKRDQTELLENYEHAYEALDLKERDSRRISEYLDDLAKQFEYIIDRSIRGITKPAISFLIHKVEGDETIRGWLDKTNKAMSQSNNLQKNAFMERLLKFGKYPEEAFVILKLLKKDVNVDPKVFPKNEGVDSLLNIADPHIEFGIQPNDETTIRTLSNKLANCGIRLSEEDRKYIAYALMITNGIGQVDSKQEMERFAARILFIADVPLNHSKQLFDKNLTSQHQHVDQERALGIVGLDNQSAPALPMPNFNSSDSSIVTYTGIGLAAVAVAAFAAKAISNFRQ